MGSGEGDCDLRDLIPVEAVVCGAREGVAAGHDTAHVGVCVDSGSFLSGWEKMRLQQRRGLDAKSGSCERARVENGVSSREVHMANAETRSEAYSQSLWPTCYTCAMYKPRLLHVARTATSIAPSSSRWILLCLRGDGAESRDVLTYPRYHTQRNLTDARYAASGRAMGNLDSPARKRAR